MFAEMPLDSRAFNLRPLPPAQGFLTRMERHHEKTI
jgi:hypothetical protein